MSLIRKYINKIPLGIALIVVIGILFVCNKIAYQQGFGFTTWLLDSSDDRIYTYEDESSVLIGGSTTNTAEFIFDVWSGNASATNYMIANEFCIDNVDNCTSGTWSSGSSGSSSWNEYTADVLTPTNTSAGIFVNASSTIDGDFTVIGNGLIQGNATSTHIAATGGNSDQWNAAYTGLHNAVTLAGQDYLTLSTQEITVGEIEPDDLASSDFGDFTCDGNTCSLDETYLTVANWDDLTNKPATSTVLNLLDTHQRISVINATTTNTDTLRVYTGAYITASTTIASNATTTGHFTANDTLYVKDGKVGIGVQAPANALNIISDENTFKSPRANNESSVLKVRSSKYDEATIGTAFIEHDTYGDVTLGATRTTDPATLGHLHLFAAGSEAMTIRGDGKVGVATTTPWGYLVVEGQGTDPSFIVSDTSNNVDFAVMADGRIVMGGMSVNVSTDADDFVIGNAVVDKGMTILGNYQSNIFFGDSVTTGGDSRIGQIRYIHGDDSMIFRANGADRLIIESDGDFGVATATPAARIHAVKTTEQLRLGYNQSLYSSFTVANDGDMVIDLNTANATTTFNDNVVISGNIGGSSPLDVVTDLIIYGNTTSTMSVDAPGFCINGANCVTNWASLAGAADWDNLLNKPATSTVLNLLDTEGRIATINASTTILGTTTLDINSPIELSTDIITASDPYLLNLTYREDLDASAKATIAFSSSTSTKAWLSVHDYLEPGNYHGHFSIETKNETSDEMNSRFGIDHGCDVCDVHIYGGDLDITSGNLLMGGTGNIEHQDDLDIYPEGQSSYSLRITTSTADDSIGLQVLGGSYLQFSDDLRVQETSALVWLDSTGGGDYASSLRLGGESGNTYQGGYFNYDASANVFIIGTHDSADTTPGNDVEVIKIDRDGLEMTVTASTTIDDHLHVIGSATTTGSFSAGQFLVGDTPLNISNWDAAYAGLHSAVTITGEDYLTLSTQEITAVAINPDNLASADFGDFTCDGTTCTLDTDYITEAELASISDLNTQISQTVLYSGGTLTDTQVCVADGTSGGIDCNIAQTYWVQDGCSDCLNATEIEDIYLLMAGDTSSGNYIFTGEMVFNSASSTITQLNTNRATSTDGFVVGADGAANSKKGCMAIQDTDLGGWTYCYTLDGTMTCGTTDCSGAATSTLIIGQ